MRFLRLMQLIGWLTGRTRRRRAMRTRIKQADTMVVFAMKKGRVV